MLYPIIISYKLTANVSVTYYRIQQYPVKYIYNTYVPLNVSKGTFKSKVRLLWLVKTMLTFTVS